MNKKVAIIYDFDYTLISGNMQEGFFIDSFGVKKEDYWALADKVMIDNNMDSILASMYVPLILSKEKGVKFDKKFLEESGRD